ncbi:MAG: urease accessory protein [Bacteroidetes bacterium]|jgi:high-affinity nickel permease|nr:urease accessory protein [Bacteroidota bacterium]
MELEGLSLLAAASIGFAHAFEADHLVAVSSIVTKRNNFSQAAKDGVFWGLGHSSTIFIIGLIMIVGKVLFQEATFEYLEAGVGIMLIILGLWRLNKLRKNRTDEGHSSHQHSVSYGIGLVHGLAGSGILVLAIMGTMKSSIEGLGFLLIFGLGSTVGMLVASGIFSIPFWKDTKWSPYLRFPLSLLSGLFCLGLGLYIVYENLH